MAKGMANFHKTMAAAGVALDQNMHAELKAGGPLAGVMGRFFKIDSGHVVTKIETGVVDAAIFEVPAGYKVKQKGTMDGKPYSMEAADASTWTRNGDAWLCALHTETMIGNQSGKAAG